MSLIVQRMMVYACAVVLVLLSLHTAHNHVTAAPASWSERSLSQGQAMAGEEPYTELLRAVISRLHHSKDKRARADGGFFSRHDAMSDYLQSAYASALASDPYGPGKRK